MAEDSVHPLLLPHVIDKIVQSESLSQRDLLSMRSVCRDWRIPATRIYAARATLVLTGDIDCKSVKRISSATELMQNTYANLPIPVKLMINWSFFSGHLETLNSLAGSKALQKDFLDFLILIAPHLEEFKCLSRSEQKHDFEFAPFDLDSFVVSFPKLRVFEIDFDNEYNTVSGRRRSWDKYLNQLAVRVFPNSSNLKVVKISALDSNAPDQTYDETLRLIPVTVEKLDLEEPLLATSSLILTSLSLPNLKCLNLIRIFGYGSYQDFYRIFDSYKENLTQLKIRLGSHVVCIKFPRFPRVITLRLDMPSFMEEPYDGEEVDDGIIEPFPYSFPQVKFLDIKRLQDPTMGELFPPGFHAPQVETCNFPDCVKSSMVMLKFALGFTNLKKLEINPIRLLKHLPIIFGNMTSLEEFIIRYRCQDANMKRHILDSVLTGIPELVCRRIWTAGNYDSVDLLEVKKKPGMTDLKQLKLFQIRAESKYVLKQYPLILSDVTGYLGFMKMENLKELKTNPNNLSQDCMDHLKVRFGNDTILDSMQYQSESNTDSDS